MDDQLFDLSLDIEYAMLYLQFVSNPVTHLHRLFELFKPEQRVKILSEAHKSVLGASTRTDKLDIFVADSLVESQPRSLKELPKHTMTKVASILSGDNPRGLGEVLLNSVLNRENFPELVSLLSSALGATVFSAEQAAALIGCLDHSEEDIKRTINSPKELMGEIQAIPKGKTTETFDDSEKPFYDFKYISTISLKQDVEALSLEISKLDGHFRWIIDQQQKLIAPEELSSRFFVQTQSTGLYIPPKQRILIAKTMQEAVQKAETDRSSILNMSPRKFEEFMAYIFVHLGFDVELTKASRDGGADLVCMKSMHGIPFRLAVEVKRYKENRPICVSLIRSFVGANRQFKANRLLFVTTSGYTQPAINFATDYASHFLTLKDYEQIKEWCTIVRANPVSLFH